jgi:hypothetical protein
MVGVASVFRQSGRRYDGDAVFQGAPEDFPQPLVLHDFIGGVHGDDAPAAFTNGSLLDKLPQPCPGCSLPRKYDIVIDAGRRVNSALGRGSFERMRHSDLKMEGCGERRSKQRN